MLKHKLMPKIVAKAFRYFGMYAITLGSTAWYVRDVERFSKPHNAHEEVHYQQIQREGLIKFYIKYLWYQIVHGYEFNPYEIEARERSGVR